MNRAFLVSACLLVLLGLSVNGQSKEASAIDALKKETSSLRTQLVELREANKLQAQQLSEAVSSTKEEVSEIHAQGEAQVNRAEAEIRQIEANFTVSTSHIRAASILLMIGLFIEITGATLLAGNSLMGGIKRVYKASIEASIVDMEMESVNKKEVADFYAYLGALLLALGFLFQFASTLISLSLTTYLSILLGVVALFVPLAILYYLTGQTPGQSRAQKIRIVFHNMNRTLVSPVVSFLIGRWRIQCDGCLRYIPLDRGQIWFVNHEEAKDHPYLFMPMFFHFGHPACLEHIDRFSSVLNPANDAVNHISPFRVDKVTPDDFMKHTYQRLHEFFQGWNRNQERVHHNAKQKAYGDVEIDNLRRRLYRAWRRVEERRNKLVRQ
jgi:hypothetical protein